MGPYDDWHRQAWRRRSSSRLFFISASPDGTGSVKWRYKSEQAIDHREVKGLNLLKKNGDVHALRDVTLRSTTALTALIGPSGCGRRPCCGASTACTTSTAPPVRGEILFEGRNICPMPRTSSMLRSRIRHGLPETDALPHVHRREHRLRAQAQRHQEQNGACGQDRDRPEERSPRVEVRDKLEQQRLRLSGGQQQRLVSPGVAVEPRCCSSTSRPRPSTPYRPGRSRKLVQN